SYQVICMTSPCQRTLKDYVACMLIWVETGYRFFHATKYGSTFETIPASIITEYTTEQLKKYASTSIARLWDLLHEKEAAYKRLLRDWEEEDLFSNPELWYWYTWTTFGHYSEHSLQIEHHFLGRTEKPLVEKWYNPWYP